MFVQKIIPKQPSYYDADGQPNKFLPASGNINICHYLTTQDVGY